jgi:hypothetical protein
MPPICGSSAKRIRRSIAPVEAAATGTTMWLTSVEGHKRRPSAIDVGLLISAMAPLATEVQWRCNMWRRAMSGSTPFEQQDFRFATLKRSDGG